MNNQRREALRKVAAQIADARDTLENLKSEEQEYFDNMPESLQSGDKGQASETACSELDEAINSLESAENNIETACE